MNLYRFLWPPGPHAGRASFVLATDEDAALERLAREAARGDASIVGGDLTPLDEFMVHFAPARLFDEDGEPAVSWIEDGNAADTFEEDGALPPSLAEARFDSKHHLTEDELVSMAEASAAEEADLVMAALLDCPRGPVGGDLSIVQAAVRGWVECLFEGPPRRLIIRLGFYPEGFASATYAYDTTADVGEVVTTLLNDAIVDARDARVAHCRTDAHFELSALGPGSERARPMVFALADETPERARDAKGSIH